MEQFFEFVFIICIIGIAANLFLALLPIMAVICLIIFVVMSIVSLFE